MFASYKVLFVLSAFVVAVFGGPARIIGGTNAAPGSSPWLASIQQGLFTHTHVAAGTIVSNRYILTAATAVNNLIAPLTGLVVANVNVRVGSNYLSSGGSRYLVYRGYLHPDFHAPTGYANVALLETLLNINFNNFVFSALLQTTEPSFDSEVSYAGWGAQSVGGLNSEQLQTLSANTISYSDCTTQAQEAAAAQGITIPAINEQREICIINAEGTGSCHGDGGNPLTSPDGSHIGTFSWALPCAVGGPEVFSRTDFFYSWIRSVIN